MNENLHSLNTKLDFRGKTDVILKWFWFYSRISRMRLSSIVTCISAWTARARSWSVGWTPRRTPPSSPGGSRRWTRDGDISRPRAWPSGERESTFKYCHPWRVYILLNCAARKFKDLALNSTKLFVTFSYFPRLKLYISLGGTKYKIFR